MIFLAHGGSPLLVAPSLIAPSIARIVRLKVMPSRWWSNAAPAIAPTSAHVLASLGMPGIAAWAVPQIIAAVRMMYFMVSFIWLVPWARTRHRRGARGMAAIPLPALVDRSIGR